MHGPETNIIALRDEIASCTSQIPLRLHSVDLSKHRTLSTLCAHQIELDLAAVHSVPVKVLEPFSVRGGQKVPFVLHCWKSGLVTPCLHYFPAIIESSSFVCSWVVDWLLAIIEGGGFTCLFTVRLLFLFVVSRFFVWFSG